MRGKVNELNNLKNHLIQSRTLIQQIRRSAGDLEKSDLSAMLQTLRDLTGTAIATMRKLERELERKRGPRQPSLFEI